MKNAYQIREALGVREQKSAPAEEIRIRVDAIKKYLTRNGFKRLVVGIYPDRLESVITALLAQKAISELRDALDVPQDYAFYAVNLSFEVLAAPTMNDEFDFNCQLNLSVAVEAIQLAIRTAVDNADSKELDKILKNQKHQTDAERNTMERIASVGLYHVAGLVGALVAGSVHAAETLEGRGAKYGHDAADLMPLAGLCRREIAAIANELKIPQALIQANLSMQDSRIEQFLALAPTDAALESSTYKVIVEGFNERGSVLPVTFSMDPPEDKSEKRIGFEHLDIRKALHVQVGSTQDEKSTDKEIERRVAALKSYMRTNGISKLVLGVSGGVDSTAAGMLAQRAINELNEEHPGTYALYAIRLPYGVQKDEADAQAALSAIKPQHILSINIFPAAVAIGHSLHKASVQVLELQQALEKERAGFHAGNTKARLRAVEQFFLSELLGDAQVIGTDQASEALMGFFTKYGDGAADVMLISGLTKQQVKSIATRLGAPEHLVNKTPTADLEDDKALYPDEEAFPAGITYAAIENFLTCDKQYAGLDETLYAAIVRQYKMAQHKREEPVSMSILSPSTASLAIRFFGGKIPPAPVSYTRELTSSLGDGNCGLTLTQKP